jgi:hypothetical protein
LRVRVIDPEFADCLFDRCLGARRFQLEFAAMGACDNAHEPEPARKAA